MSRVHVDSLLLCYERKLRNFIVVLNANVVQFNLLVLYDTVGSNGSSIRNFRIESNVAGWILIFPESRIFQIDLETLQFLRFDEMRFLYLFVT